MSNYPSVLSPLPHNAASYAYVKGTGVYLKTSQGKIPVYNTLYPFFGTPALDGAVLAEGPYPLTVESADTVGHKSVFASEFIVDRTPSLPTSLCCMKTGRGRLPARTSTLQGDRPSYGR